ncbi:MAG: hypothetical protein ABJH63_07950 [Rhizobiaceae bacterium]
MPKVTKNSLKILLSVSGLALLAACQSTGVDGVFSNVLPKKKEQNTQVAATSSEAVPGTNPNARSKLINVRNELTDYCPAVRIRAGTESMRFYKGKDKSNDDNLRYQATLTKVARECAYVGQSLEIKVGALGRVITGPAGGPGTVKMPIRVAVQQGGCSRHFELHQTQASIASGTANSKFEFVDEKIVIPAPTATNVRIYLGFDETPKAKSSAEVCT